MSRPPYHTYPRHHPHHGRPYIIVHNHDVLCGRGVNIAQHPGNERFRALVNTRHDELYCTTFTTSEKRALAEEIVSHISSLEPPGRFLKRSGRSQSARGMNGPWEELSHREKIKKTCQALRDCNRSDRQGYAAQVSIPQDVKDNAAKRVQSGLTLKEHAAAAAAKVNSTDLCPTHLDFEVPEHQHLRTANNRTKHQLSNETLENRDKTKTGDVTSFMLAGSNDDEKYKRKSHTQAFVGDNSHVERDILPPSGFTPIVNSTPASRVAAVPVTNTPATYQYSHLSDGDSGNVHLEHIKPPQMPSPVSFHRNKSHDVVTLAADPAPFSPLVGLHPQQEAQETSEIEGTAKVYFARQAPLLAEIDSSGICSRPSQDETASSGVLASATEINHDFIGNPSSDDGYSLVCEDGIVSGTLGIQDFA